MNAVKPARTAKPDKSPLPAEPATFGRYLRFVRRAREFNQSDVAALLNVTQVSVSKWEGEEAVPSPEHHLALSRFLRIPVSEVRDRVERQVLEQRAAKLRRELAAVDKRLRAFQVPGTERR
jgi:transcriptional regulator with XRE-family HTH domain